MEKEIKLEEKEIKEIREIRGENSRMTVDFGRIRLEIILLKAKLSELEKMDSDMEAKYKGNRTKEHKISEKLNKKYGMGTVNIDKGTFIPESLELSVTPVEDKDGKS